MCAQPLRGVRGWQSRWSGISAVIAERELSSADALRSLTLECEHRLAEVIGHVARAIQQDREAIPRRILREIFFRNGRVPQGPVVRRHLFKPLPQFGIDDTPCTANLFVRRNVGSRPVGIRDKGDIELRMKSFSQREQRQHGVVDGCQMSPQVKHSIPARRNFPKDLLGRERSKKLVRPIDLGLPGFQPESCERRVVSHASISCQLMGVEPLTNIRDGKFASKDDLAAETTARVLKNPGWQEWLTGKENPSFADVVRGYLSPRHRDDPGTGCLIAALGSDAARQPRAVRRALTDGLRVRLDAWMKLVPGRSVAARREKALVAMATLVGALVIARAVDDPALSDEVLEATATELRGR